MNTRNERDDCELERRFGATRTSLPRTPKTGRQPMIVDTPGGAIFVKGDEHVCICPPRSWVCEC